MTLVLGPLTNSGGADYDLAAKSREIFNIAFENSPLLRKANVVTHGLHSYPYALDDLGYDTEKRHIRYVGWDWDPVKKINNNRLQRQW